MEKSAFSPLQVPKLKNSITTNPKLGLDLVSLLAGGCA
jgi:hypothetical protein